MKNLILALTAAALLLDGAEVRNPIPDSWPEASIDLMTDEGAALARAQWRYSDTRIIGVDFKGPGPDGQPTGRPIETYDYVPHAGGADFDDSAWEQIAPTSLSQRRSTGR